MTSPAGELGRLTVATILGGYFSWSATSLYYGRRIVTLEGMVTWCFQHFDPLGTTTTITQNPPLATNETTGPDEPTALSGI